MLALSDKQPSCLSEKKKEVFYLVIYIHFDVKQKCNQIHIKRFKQQISDIPT